MQNRAKIHQKTLKFKYNVKRFRRPTIWFCIRFSDDPSGPTHTLFDKVFFFGDLNYRLGCERVIADSLIKSGLHDQLLNYDQLLPLMAGQEDHLGGKEKLYKTGCWFGAGVTKSRQPAQICKGCVGGVREEKLDRCKKCGRTEVRDF